MQRKKSESGFYHVCLRGVARRALFLNNAMRYAFLDYLERAAERHRVKVIAWCLMENHVHLVLEDEHGALGSAMRALTAPFARYHNKCTDGAGHVFEGSYRSSPIEDESYLLQVVRYVHNNPVKAGVCRSASAYFWSSYREYVRKEKLAKTALVLEMLGGVEGFEAFHRAG